MATLYIDFTEPTPTPASYKVRYKPTVSATWTEVTLASPPPFSITSGIVTGTSYNVEVYTDCGSGVFSTPDTTASTVDDCQEFTFSNSSGIDQTLDYTLCGTTSMVSIAITNGSSVGPLCLSISQPYFNPEGGLTVFSGAPCTP